MGLNVCTLLIQLSKTNIELNDNDLECKLKKISSNSPVSLSIAIPKKGHILIFWEGIVKMQNNSEEELTNIEADISRKFQGCSIVTIILSDTVNLLFYRYVDEGTLKREKGIYNGELRNDVGEPLKVEIKYAEQINGRNDGKDPLSLLGKKMPNSSYGQRIRALLKIYSKNATDPIYTSGTLDDIICNNFFKNATDGDYLSVLDTEIFYVFKLRKIDFSKDSLSRYINKALFLNSAKKVN
jgi:hypothetical protein